MPHTKRQRLGRLGEDLAARYLASQGYTILERGYRAGRTGEIDIVARQGDTIVMVEVKARRALGHGLPEEAITPTKAAHLIAAAETYLQDSHLSDSPWRIDVVAITLHHDGTPERITLITHAISAD